MMGVLTLPTGETSTCLTLPSLALALRRARVPQLFVRAADIDDPVGYDHSGTYLASVLIGHKPHCLFTFLTSPTVDHRTSAEQRREDRHDTRSDRVTTDNHLPSRCASRLTPASIRSNPLAVRRHVAEVGAALAPIISNLGGLRWKDGRGPDGGGAAARGDVPEVAIRTHRVIVTARRSEGYRLLPRRLRDRPRRQRCLDSVRYPLQCAARREKVGSSRSVGQRRPGKPTQDSEAHGVQSTRRSSVRYRARLAKYFSTVASVDPSGTW